MPVVLVLDWLVDPPRHRLPAWTVLAWLAYPTAWLAYTLVRGEIVDWCPYPFVDVSNLGYDGVLARAAGLTVVIALAAARSSGSGTGAPASEERRRVRAERATLRRPWSTALSAS